MSTIFEANVKQKAELVVVIYGTVLSFTWAKPFVCPLHVIYPSQFILTNVCVTRRHALVFAGASSCDTHTHTHTHSLSLSLSLKLSLSLSHTHTHTHTHTHNELERERDLKQEDDKTHTKL